MKRFIELLKAYFPAIIWAGIIFLFSSQTSLPGFEASPIDFFFKKSAHVFVYMILYLLLKRAVEMTVNKKSTNIQLFLPILISLVYATSDEFHQSMIPGRYATIQDIGYDMFGVSIAFLRKYDFI